MNSPMMNKDEQCAAYLVDVQYHTKENLSRACTDIFEDLLRKTYDLDEPLASSPYKCSSGTQTGPSSTALAQRKVVDFKKINEYVSVRFLGKLQSHHLL